MGYRLSWVLWLPLRRSPVVLSSRSPVVHPKSFFCIFLLVFAPHIFAPSFVNTFHARPVLFGGILLPAMQVFLSTPGAWHLRDTAKAFENRNALAALWCTERNRTGISPSRYRRCWPFHLAMYPFYLWTSEIRIEKAFYAYFPSWRLWQKRQKLPAFQVAHSPMGFATEAFDRADAVGALKVIDCPNSHPTTYHGFWQRECDLWCPGEKVPIPRRMFARMNRELERA